MLFLLHLRLIKILDMQLVLLLNMVGAGSSGAAPIAKKVIKKVLERHKLRKKYQLDLFQEV